MPIKLSQSRRLDLREDTAPDEIRAGRFFEENSGRCYPVAAYDPAR